MDLARALVAGLVATVIMTMLMVIAPLMGLPPLNMGALLGATFGVSQLTGWALHFTVGAVLGGVYASMVGALPGGSFFRGLLFGFFTFLVAQIVAMPIMGLGVFMGGVGAAVVASLFAHLIFGAMVGVLYGTPGTHITAAHARR